MCLKTLVGSGSGIIKKKFGSGSGINHSGSATLEICIVYISFSLFLLFLIPPSFPPTYLFTFPSVTPQFPLPICPYFVPVPPCLPVAGSTRNSTVPALLYPTLLHSFTASSRMFCRSTGSRFWAGAISTTCRAT